MNKLLTVFLAIEKIAELFYLAIQKGRKRYEQRLSDRQKKNVEEAESGNVQHLEDDLNSHFDN